MQEPDEDILAIQPQYIRIHIKNPNKDPRFLNQVPASEP